MVVWWKNHFPSNGLESSNWNNHKKTGCLEFQANLFFSRFRCKTSNIWGHRILTFSDHQAGVQLLWVLWILRFWCPRLSFLDFSRTPLKFNSFVPKNRLAPKRERIIFNQASFFRGNLAVKFRGGVATELMFFSHRFSPHLLHDLEDLTFFRRITNPLQGRSSYKSIFLTPTRPETTIFAPKNGWLEYDPFLLGFGLFSGAMLVSERVIKLLRLL